MAPPKQPVQGAPAHSAAAEESEALSPGQNDEAGTERAYDLFGGLRFSLQWQPTQKQLNLRVRQYAETTTLEADAQAQVNSVTGEHRVLGLVRKNFYTHTPSLQRLLVAKAQRQEGLRPDEPDLDPDAWLPCGLGSLVFKDWLLAPGLLYDTAAPRPTGSSVRLGGMAAAISGASGTSSLKYALTLRKNPQVLKQGARSDLWLAAKALCTVDPKSAEVAAVAGVRLKMLKVNVTNKQDVSISVGMDVQRRGGGPLIKSPYVKVADNNFAARLQRGQWTLMYQL